MQVCGGSLVVQNFFYDNDTEVVQVQVKFRGW